MHFSSHPSMIRIRNRLFRATTTLLLFLVVVADVASASWSSNLRFLIASTPSQSPNLTANGAPLLSPTKEIPKVTPPIDEGKKETKDDQVKGNSDTRGGSESSKETCDGLRNTCRDSKTLVACIMSVNDESKTMVLLIQNQGDTSLKVNISVPNSDENKGYDIAEHKSLQINVSLNGATGNSVLHLDAGNGDCVIKLDSHHVVEDNFFKWLPPYSELLTPVYGAYFLLLATVIVGGVWACCIFFSKRKRRDEVPYQELEMGISGSHVDVETADGWDQGWDDDWDDNKAVRSPGARKIGSISANGLTSRSGNRDGWEEWDE